MCQNCNINNNHESRLSPFVLLSYCPLSFSLSPQERKRRKEGEREKKGERERKEERKREREREMEREREREKGKVQKVAYCNSSKCTMYAVNYAYTLYISSRKYFAIIVRLSDG